VHGLIIPCWSMRPASRTRAHFAREIAAGYNARSPTPTNMPESNAPQPQKKSRRQMLEEFAASHPNDAFSLYGLAIECANQGDHAAATETFQKLLAQHPDYVTGYFQYGQFLARISRIGEAKRTLTAGIEVARRTGDNHAADEMAAALAQL